MRANLTFDSDSLWDYGPFSWLVRTQAATTFTNFTSLISLLLHWSTAETESECPPMQQ